MPSSRFQWAPAAGVRSPSAPELDRRENTVPIGKDYSPGPGVARRLCNAEPKDPGPAGNAVAKPLRARSTRLDRRKSWTIPRGVNAAGVESAAWRLRSRGLEQLSFRLLGPQPGSCGVPHRHRPQWKHSPLNIHRTEDGLKFGGRPVNGGNNSSVVAESLGPDAEVKL
jgi:hypothetical protein